MINVEKSINFLTKFFANTRNASTENWISDHTTQKSQFTKTMDDRKQLSNNIIQALFMTRKDEGHTVIIPRILP